MYRAEGTAVAPGRDATRYWTTWRRGPNSRIATGSPTFRRRLRSAGQGVLTLVKQPGDGAELDVNTPPATPCCARCAARASGMRPTHRAVAHLAAPSDPARSARSLGHRSSSPTSVSSPRTRGWGTGARCRKRSRKVRGCSRMSSQPAPGKARLVITAVVVEKRPVAQVVRDYGVSRSWVYELLARYRAEGDAAFEPWSRRPKTSPRATPPATVELVLRLRKQLDEQGLDAGPGHDRLAPGPSRRARARAGQAPPLLLHPLRGRPTQRVLAVRLHPGLFAALIRQSQLGLPAHPRRTTQARCMHQPAGPEPPMDMNDRAATFRFLVRDPVLGARPLRRTERCARPRPAGREPLTGSVHRRRLGPAVVVARPCPVGLCAATTRSRR